MKKLLFLLLNTIVLTIVGCSNNTPESEEWNSERTIIVASKKLFGIVPNIEHQLVDSLYATKNAQSDEEWKAFSMHIEGFNYQSGYEYVLKLNVRHVREYQDGEVLVYYEEYRAKEVLSKLKKESNNLPVDFLYGKSVSNN